MKKFVLFAMAAALCLSMLIVPVSAGSKPRCRSEVDTCDRR